MYVLRISLADVLTFIGNSEIKNLTLTHQVKYYISSWKLPSSNSQKMRLLSLLIYSHLRLCDIHPILSCFVGFVYISLILFPAKLFFRAKSFFFLTFGYFPESQTYQVFNARFKWILNKIRLGEAFQLIIDALGIWLLSPKPTALWNWKKWESSTVIIRY